MQLYHAAYINMENSPAPWATASFNADEILHHSLESIPGKQTIITFRPGEEIVQIKLTQLKTCIRIFIRHWHQNKSGE